MSLVGITSAVHPSITMGNKTVVAAGCLVGENTQIGDKSSVKRSVIGNGAKYAISALMKAHSIAYLHFLHTIIHTGKVARGRLTSIESTKKML